ncbi:MAG TPA: outer membrane beta-barrel protein [Chryseolinea sp.]|nr:outer membrane beta-barrel protein [Chryseolinea sp.]
MKFRNLPVLCLLLTGFSIASYGQDSTKAFTFGGSVDTYFHSSFGMRNAYPGDGDGGPSGSPAPNTSFANLKGFSLGMVNLIASYSGDKVGFTADVVFGPRGYDAVFGPSYTGQRIVNQLFAYYKFNDAITLNIGQFNTFLGYEVISPAVNFHYSTSYMFSWGPFNHTGLRADFNFGEGWVGKLAVMNPTDIVEFNPTNTYTAGLQVGKTSDAGGIWLNLLYGDQDGKLDSDTDGNGSTSLGTLFQADITAGWNVSELFYLGLNATYQTVGEGEQITGGNVQGDNADSHGFYGVALYPKLTLSETFSLGLRAEYFGMTNNHLGFNGGPIFGTDSEGDGSVMEFTLSGNYKVGGLTFIPEFRIDKTSEDSFYKKDEIGNLTGPDKTLFPTVNVAAVYKF